jgi:hypothetical protein
VNASRPGRAATGVDVVGSVGVDFRARSIIFGPYLEAWTMTKVQKPTATAVGLHIGVEW